MYFGQRGVILTLGEVRSFIRKPYIHSWTYKMKIVKILLPLMLFACAIVIGCSSQRHAVATCPNGHGTLSNIPVVYMSDLGRMDKKIQQSVQNYEFFLSHDKKVADSPKTITVCTTCGFTYHPDPKEYWEKDGHSFEEFSVPFSGVSISVCEVRAKTRPMLKQRVRNGIVIYEETYFVDGLDLQEINTSILNTLKSRNMQVQEGKVEGASLSEYIFTEGNSTYRLTFPPWYSGQWGVLLKREVNMEESNQRMDSDKK
jgi:hypothetical protein